MIKWTVHKITFFPLMSGFRTCLVSSCLVLYCLVLYCFCSFKGVQQVPGFCLPLHLLHPVFVVFNDFDVVWFRIFDGNKTELNWSSLPSMVKFLTSDGLNTTTVVTEELIYEARYRRRLLIFLPAIVWTRLVAGVSYQWDSLYQRVSIAALAGKVVTHKISCG